MPRINPKIFKEYDVRGQYPWELDESAAYQIARAFVFLKKCKKVAVARDAREESAKIAQAFIHGLVDGGAKVFNLGLDSTPALFFAVGLKQFDGGVMVTASHNPDGYTGLKMCGRDGVLIGANSGLKKIARLAEEKTFKPLNKKTAIKDISILADYYKFVLSFVDEKKIRPLKLVLDASGGAGVKMADYIFVRLPGKVTKMNFKKGDRFPDHDLNPILPKNHQAICAEVKKQKARLGIIWDGDGDRCVLIDESGRFVEPYHLNCLLSQLILAKWPKIKVLIDARLKLVLSAAIKQAGGRALVHRSGYANIVKTMQARKLLFGCENSGHFMFNFLLAGRKKNYAFGDGIIPALLVLEYLSQSGRNLSQTIAPFKKSYLISGERNFPAKNFPAIRAKVIKKYGRYRREKIDGLSVFSTDWFFNIRPSHTEPLVRLNIEAKDRQTLKALLKDLIKIIK